MVKLDDKVRKFLEEPRFASLATINADGSPQQTVMWYLLRGDEIMMNTARGRKKDRNMLRDRRVSICVEDGYRFVTIEGEVHLIEDQVIAQVDIWALAERYHGRARADKMARDQFGKQERITMIMSIQRVMSHGFEDEA
jgi:PPOX class probable F420-dependent enzyme